MDAPRRDDLHTPEYRLIFATMNAPEQAGVLTVVEEVSRETESIRELTEAIQDIDQAYVPTFLSI